MPITNPSSVSRPAWKTTRSYTCMTNTGTARASRLMTSDSTATSRNADHNGRRKGRSQERLAVRMRFTPRWG